MTQSTSFDKYSQITNFLLKDRKSIIVFSLFTSVLCLLIVAFYAISHISNVTRIPYDIDGWGFLITGIDSSKACFAQLSDPLNSNRGFMLPLIFGTTYCIAQFEESVQLFNVLSHSLTCFLLTLFAGIYLRHPLPAAAICIIWSIWPAYSYLFGFYFSEPFSGLVYLTVFIIAASISSKPKPLIFFILLGITLGFLLHIRPPSLLMILFLLLYLFFVKKVAIKPMVFTLVTLIAVYMPLPVYNYSKLQAVVPFTTQGGFAMFEGTYLPGDDMPASYLREIEEFNQIEQKTTGMSAIEIDRYYKDLAMQNIIADPVGQVILFGKKLLRFWFYIPAHEWVPSTKSIFFAGPVLFFWCWGCLLVFKNGVRRSNENQIAIIITIGTWLMYALIHSEYRYSYVVFPFILYTALLGFLHFIHKYKLTSILPKSCRKSP